MADRLCTSCRHFNGMNMQETCLVRSSHSPVRGIQSKPLWAPAMRAKGWLGMFKGPCGPEGKLWEKRGQLTPPRSGSAVMECAPKGLRLAVIEEAAKVCDERAKWHAESFRKEVVLKHEDRQTHFAARHREAEELAAAIRQLGDKA